MSQSTLTGEANRGGVIGAQRLGQPPHKLLSRGDFRRLSAALVTTVCESKKKKIKGGGGLHFLTDGSPMDAWA